MSAFGLDSARCRAPLRAGAGRARAGDAAGCRSLAGARLPARRARPGASAAGLRQRGGRRERALRVTCLRDSVQGYEALTRNRALSAYSPLRSVQSVAKLFTISGTATVCAWYAHPHLLNLAAHVLHLDFKDSVTAFQTSFFSFLSLVFAVYSGNTMAFLYDRQKEVVKNLFEECMALEELLEESVNALGPDARDILAQIRLYIEQEILAPENQSPPLGDGHALAAIRAKARNYRRSGTEVADILQASQRLAHAQSTRQASACRLLPPVHWALLYTIGTLFVSTFILFETGGSFSNEGRHILFTTLCGLMSFVLTTLRDLADPTEGVYNGTALLDERLGYIRAMLNKYEQLPVKVGNSTATLLVGSSIPSGQTEAEEAERERESRGVGSVIHAVTEKVSGVLKPREKEVAKAALSSNGVSQPPGSSSASPGPQPAAPAAGHRTVPSPHGNSAAPSGSSSAAAGNGAGKSSSSSSSNGTQPTAGAAQGPASQLPGQLAPRNPSPQTNACMSVPAPQGPYSTLPQGTIRWDQQHHPTMRYAELTPSMDRSLKEQPSFSDYPSLSSIVQGPSSRWPQGAPRTPTGLPPGAARPQQPPPQPPHSTPNAGQARGGPGSPTKLDMKHLSPISQRTPAQAGWAGQRDGQRGPEAPRTLKLKLATQQG